MKLAAFAVALTLLLMPYGRGVNRQNRPGDTQTTPGATPRIQELEARFKEIDEESEQVEVTVLGGRKTSGRARIRLVKEVTPPSPPPPPPGTETANANTPPRAADAKPKKVSLLDVNLSARDVPDEYINQKVSAAFEAGMVGSLPGLKVLKIEPTPNYEVVEDYTYNAGSYSITAPKGFVYDRASIPRVFWVVIDKDSLSNVAPLFHDLLYRNGGVLPRSWVSPYRTFTRQQTDDLFRELMEKSGVVPWRREAAYQAVRKFSWFAWKAPRTPR